MHFQDGDILKQPLITEQPYFDRCSVQCGMDTKQKALVDAQSALLLSFRHMQSKCSIKYYCKIHNHIQPDQPLAYSDNRMAES